VLAQLEGCDRVLGPDHHRVLPGDRGQIADGGVDLLRVLHRLADTHVDDDLVEARHLHRVLVAEFLHQGRLHYLLIALVKAGRGGSLTHLSSTSPERRANRTLRPSSSVLVPTRVGFPDCGSIWATLEASI